jgi:hypothetical protein
VSDFVGETVGDEVGLLRRREGDPEDQTQG